MCHHRSPLEQGGGVRSRATCGSIGALPSKEVGSRAVGHVAALEAGLTGRQGLEPQRMWQCADVRPSPCLGLKLVCGVPGLQVPTVAPVPTSGEAANPQVGPTLRWPTRLS
jgi:hypothetical protein